VETPGELGPALEAAFACDGPCLLDLHVESLADRVPPVYSWLKRRGKDPLALDPEDVSY
jgi:acetolactate synthase-1/2/3 large subunit